MFIETSQAKLLAPAERYIKDQLEDCRLKIIRLKTLLIFNLLIESNISPPLGLKRVKSVPFV
jgi:5-bromo-4-chloroindolyl phosphate hydrolysis protein